MTKPYLSLNVISLVKVCWSKIEPVGLPGEQINNSCVCCQISAGTASKSGINGITKALAKEVSNDGIRVHLINPGGVLTDMVRQARPDLPPDANDMIAPEDIADIIYFILSHRSNAIIDEINVHRRTKEPFL